MSNNGQRVIVPDDRIFDRGQGCWNCRHMQSGKEFWQSARLVQLTVAQGIANNSREGERDQRVKNIRGMVDSLDHAVASGAMIRCTKGKTPDGNPVGDLVAHNYLCHEWSGATGASLAREGRALDALPEELVDKLDGQPSNLDNLISDKLTEGE